MIAITGFYSKLAMCTFANKLARSQIARWEINEIVNKMGRQELPFCQQTALPGLQQYRVTALNTVRKKDTPWVSWTSSDLWPLESFKMAIPCDEVWVGWCLRLVGAQEIGCDDISNPFADKFRVRVCSPNVELMLLSFLGCLNQSLWPCQLRTQPIGTLIDCVKPILSSATEMQIPIIQST